MDTLFSITATSAIVALPGIPATLITFVAPPAAASGTPKPLVEL
jgi:hypothetical protein